GFNLYVKTADGLEKVNLQLIPSQAVDSLSPLNYTYSAAKLKGAEFYIEDVNLMGDGRMHGPFALGKAFGQRSVESTIPWASIRSENNLLETKRQAANAADAAKRSAQAQAVLSAIAEKDKDKNNNGNGNGS